MLISKISIASSVTVERSFSRGRILISHLHNRLCADTIRALMCFGDWSREDFVSNAELVEFLMDKGKDPKGKAKVVAEDDDDVEFVDDEVFLL